MWENFGNINYHSNHTQKYLAGEKLANCELFAKIFLANIFTNTPKMYLAYALTAPNFSSPITFTCMICQNFPAKYFP